jgi:hypothetical protein
MRRLLGFVSSMGRMGVHRVHVVQSGLQRIKTLKEPALSENGIVVSVFWAYGSFLASCLSGTLLTVSAG